jgi:hypothetical protein
LSKYVSLLYSFPIDSSIYLPDIFVLLREHTLY